MAKRPDNWNKMSPEDQALWNYINSGEEFTAGGAAQFSSGDALNHESLDPNQLAELQRSGFEDISTDPMLRNAQLDALRQLEEQSNTGFTTRDEADMAKLRADVNRTNRGRSGAIQQNMAARGMSGSGMDLVAQMQASQDATEREALASLEQNAQMLDRKNEAVMQRGQMSGAMRNQDFGEAARKAEARDAINRFNTANQVNAQVQNNQGRNNTNAQNWNRNNQTSDRNVQAGYDFRKDNLGVNQNNAEFSYNKAADDYNRAQLKKQQKAAKKSGMMSGVLGAAGGVVGAVYGGPVGAAAGYQVGSAVGGAAANYARGGKIPGQAPFPGDNEMNDIFPAMLSPGEVVLPRTVADDPFEAAQFVSEQNMRKADPTDYSSHTKSPFYPTPDGRPVPKAEPQKKMPAKAKPAPIPEPILTQLAATQPDLVAQYRQKMSEADKGVKDAEDMQGYMGIANLIGKAGTDFANSQKEDVILKNRMQDLGAGPTVVAAKRTEYDGSALDRLAAQGVARAEKNRASTKEGFWDEQKLKEVDHAQRLKDPNSAESQSAKAILKSIFPKDQHAAIDGMSSAQLDKYSPLFMDKLKNERSQANADREYALKERELGIKASAKKQLNGEEQKRYDHSAMTLTGVRDMRSALSNGDNTFSIVGDNDFTKAARRAAEAFGRAQSGGAINKDEEARFMAMLPTKWDTAEMQQKKLNDIELEVSARIREMGRDPDQAYANRQANPSSPSTGNKPTWAK